jgi:hypothetical protein
MQCNTDTRQGSDYGVGGTWTADRGTIVIKDIDLENNYDYVRICEFASNCFVISYM